MVAVQHLTTGGVPRIRRHDEETVHWTSICSTTSGFDTCVYRTKMGSTCSWLVIPVKNILFASEMPIGAVRGKDPVTGPSSTTPNALSIGQTLSADDRNAIYEDGTRRLLVSTRNWKARAT